MRTTVGVMLGVVIMGIGLPALSFAAQDAEEPAQNTTNGGDAYNLSTDVFGGIGDAAGPGIVFMGVAAIVIVSLGILVVAGRSGGR